MRVESRCWRAFIRKSVRVASISFSAVFGRDLWQFSGWPDLSIWSEKKTFAKILMRLFRGRMKSLPKEKKRSWRKDRRSEGKNLPGVSRKISERTGIRDSGAGTGESYRGACRLQ